MAFDGGEVERNLPTKGFVIDRTRDHIYFHFWKDGKKTRFHTKVSHGARAETIGDDLVRAMKMQLGLQTAKQVRDLVKCPMDQAGYIRALQNAGGLPR
jgi:hypothetical protein